MPILGLIPEPSDQHLATGSESAQTADKGDTRGSIDELAYQSLHEQEKATIAWREGKTSFINESTNGTTHSGRRDFSSLLNELLEEHNRCLRDAACGRSAQDGQRPHTPMSEGKSVCMNNDVTMFFFTSELQDKAEEDSKKRKAALADLDAAALAAKAEAALAEAALELQLQKDDEDADDIPQEILKETIPLAVKTRNSILKHSEIPVAEETRNSSKQSGTAEKVVCKTDFDRQSSGNSWHRQASSGSSKSGQGFDSLLPRGSPKTNEQRFDSQLSLLSSAKSCSSSAASSPDDVPIQVRPPTQSGDAKTFMWAPSRPSTDMTYSESISSTAGRRTWEQIIGGTWFELFIACLIIVNTIIMAVEIQYYGLESGYIVQYPTYDQAAQKAWPNVTGFFIIAERTFTIIFTVELVLRLSVFRCKFFKTCQNYIDVLTVVIGWLDWLATEAAFVNPTVARLMRLAKLSRGVRLAKLTGALSSLHLLSKCVTGSAATLSWSVSILLVAQCISGMLISQLVYGFIMDESKDLVARQDVFAYYGTFTRSLITMFEVHLANFGPACRILLDNMGEEYAYVFLAYRCLAGFAIINVINAVFVQQTISVAQEDQEVILNQKNKEANAYARTIKKFLERIDTNGDGHVTEDQLVSFEDDPTYQLWMNTMDIGDADLRGLFRMIDVNKEGTITADEFILGAARIKGPAKSVDMVQVLAHLNQLQRKVQALAKSSSFDASSDSWSRQSSPAPLVRRDSFHHGL